MFKRKSTTKKKAAVNKTDEKKNSVESSSSSSNLISLFESCIDSLFFYVNDAQLYKNDAVELVKCITMRYPDLIPENDDKIIKQGFILLFLNADDMQNILNSFKISIYDFFKMIYSSYDRIFKGPFLKKIQKIIILQPYAKV